MPRSLCPFWGDGEESPGVAFVFWNDSRSMALCADVIAARE